MRREVWSGTILIAGALTGVLVLALHPTGHDLLAGADRARQATIGIWIHAVAIAGVPMVFLGLLGLWRRLGKSDLATAALVVFGFGGVSVISAAVASGFISTPLIQRILAEEGATRDTYHALLTLSGLMNQGFAKVHTVATAVAILLWSAAVLQSVTMQRAVAIAGFLVGGGVLGGFFTGRLAMDVHGFGIITFAQSSWLILVGALLWRGEELKDAA